MYYVRYPPEMITISVCYPKTKESHFDFDYYLTKHMPMVKDRFERFGLNEVRLMRGTATLDGSMPRFELIGELVFPSVQHALNALNAHGTEILDDIPMFTDIKPAIQINEML